MRRSATRAPVPRVPRGGVEVALGTDSLASNPDLDVLAEYACARHCPDVSGETLLRMATPAAQAARLGRGHQQPGAGRSADLVIVPLPDAEAADPHDLVLASDLPVRATLFRGQWVAARAQP